MKYEKIPNIPLGELMLKGGGSTDPRKHPDDKFLLYSIPAYDTGVPELCVGAGIGSSKKNVEPNDVLLSRIVPHIRRSWVVGEHGNSKILASSEWIVFRSHRIYPPFLRRFLMSDLFHGQFMRTVAGVGGSLLRARPAEVQRILVPLPPLEEQRRIAAILDKADALRQKRKQAIALLDSLTQSIFLEMFDDPQKNPKGFDKGKIQDLLADASYGTSSKAGDTGEFPILRMGNITYEGRLDTDDLKYINLPTDQVEKYTVRKGDILFNRTNSAELVGKTAVFDQDRPFAFAGYLVRARVNSRALPEYVAGYLNSRHGKAVLRNKAKAIVGMANINAKEMQSIPILIPPVGLQKTYADRLMKIRGAKEGMLASMHEAEEVFSSLQHRAFSGQL